MKVALTATPWIVNSGFFLVGMTLLWFETHSLWAMAYAFLASLHFTFSIKSDVPQAEMTGGDKADVPQAEMTGGERNG